MTTANRTPLRPITQLLISAAIIILAVAATLVIFRYPERFGPFFVGALVVTRGDAILGLVSEREIVHAISRHG